MPPSRIPDASCVKFPGGQPEGSAAEGDPPPDATGPAELLPGSPAQRGASAAGRLAYEVALGRGPRARRWTLLAEDRPVRLAELVPLAWRISEITSAQTVREAAEGGRTIACRKGCSHCCHLVVPLSAPEALRLCEDLDALPAHRSRAVMQPLLGGARRLLAAGPPAAGAAGGGGSGPGGRLGRWAAALNLPCPLLVGDACALYDRRPLACREHLVTGDPACCAAASPAAPDVRPPPWSMVNLLAALAAEIEHRRVESVLLPLAPAWRDAQGDRARRAYRPQAVYPRLVRLLRIMSAHGARAAAPTRAA
jgi:hypothetical protein